MAKIKFGMMMTDARGKLGGQVFSKNRSGAYVRTKVTPVNPRTTSQQSNRFLLGSLSAMWSGLSDSQRKAWNNAVENWQKTNVFGDLSKPTGKNLFTGLNKNVLAYTSGDTMLSPPPKGEFAEVSDIAARFVTDQGLLLTVSGRTVAGEYVVYATPPLSAGTTYVKNKLRVIGTIAYTAEPVNLITQYESTLGSLVITDNVYVEVRQILPNGQLGTPVSVKMSR